MKLTKCPFCGRVNDTDDEDTLYPTGSYWATGTVSAALRYASQISVAIRPV